MTLDKAKSAPEFTLFASTVRGNKHNAIYQNRMTIKTCGDLATAVSYDHVSAEYANSRRTIRNFVKSDCYPFDVDNGHTDDPAHWVTPKQVQQAFPNVPYFVAYSRNHMKEKDGKSPRPRFHVYMPDAEIDCADEYKRRKEAAISYFPAFDSNAKDAARFFFGVEEPQVEYYGGDTLLSEFMETLPKAEPKKTKRSTPSIPAGERNSTLSHFAGRVLKKYGDADGKAKEAFLEEAAKCTPQLDEKELATIWNSALSFYRDTIQADPDYIPPSEYETDEPKPSGKGDTQATKLLSFVESSGARFILSDTSDPYAVLPVAEHNEILPVDGKDFATWLHKLYYEKTGKTIGSEAVKQTLSVLSAKARFDHSEPIPLHTRVAGDNNIIWYDLTNPDWQAIRATAQGWNIISDPPTLFRRYRHQSAQVMPMPGGDIRKALNYINLRGQETLFLCWLVSCFVPDIPHAMIIFYGEKGSAKTTASALTKAIIDPSALSTLALQRDSRTQVVNLQQHWYLPFDNVSYINEETSDALCRAITGGGIQQRKLYTNDDDAIFTFKRCLAINGINNVATRPDLLDRSILMELERISETERRESADLQTAFEADRAAILGGVFDTLSKAMAIFPGVKLDKLPRMADFARWGYSIGEALGGLGQEFLEQYAHNRETQNDEAIANDPVATLIVELMRDKDSWDNTVTALYAELHILASKHKIRTWENNYPKDPTRLSKRIRSIRSNLGAVGISVEFPARGSQAQRISLKS